ncbi:helix-turn-helix domain-containing protein [Paenibacillus sp. JJ-223]|uniref:helix-turn-helix domain-containing protein n=1 Tax=Paenibacillus sp. JJ-223 TaxID=2905647 RepID=UPI001F256489|nr:helix-turn-helix domain-containing protein [Paenibacillus sp. JJ-223]CAH1207116.1 HTH-type transcriptional regulator YesS [Paenibacillus sp. JJ-223]
MFIKRMARGLPGGRYFRRSLLTMLMIACIPGIVTGGLLYIWINVRMESILQEAHAKQLEQRALWVGEQLDTLELNFSQWAFDPVFDHRLKELDFIYKYKQVHELYRLLLMIRHSNPLIDDVQLYLKEPRAVMMNSERYDFLTAPAEISSYEGLLRRAQGAYWTRSADGASPMLVNRLPAGAGDTIGALILTVDAGQLESMLGTLSPYAGGTTFLLNADGTPLFPQDREVSALQAAVGLERNRLADSGSPNSFLMEYEGTTYSVLSGDFRRLGHDWIYVSASPLNEIVAPIVSVPRLILAVSGAGLLLALALSWIGSLRLYQPLQRLLRLFTGIEPAGIERGRQESMPGNDMLSGKRRSASRMDEMKHIEQHWLGVKRERESLQQRLEEQLPLARNNLLQQLTLGQLHSSSDREWRARLAELGWAVQDEHFIVMLCHIRPVTLLQKNGNPFGKESPEWIGIMAADMLTQRAGELPCLSETINYHDLSIALLLAVPPHGESGIGMSRFREEVCRIGQQWIDAVQAEWGVRVTVAVSQACADATHLPKLVQEARAVLRKRRFSSASPLTDMAENAEEAGMDRAFYPLELEQDILAALRNGSEQEAMDRFRDFANRYAASASPGEQVRQAMYQLLAHIQHALAQLGEDPVRLFGLGLYEEVMELHDLEETCVWFRERIIRICVEEFTGREEKQVQMAVHHMKEHAETQYAEALSLDELADAHGIHAYTLSRAFKQAFGQNFVDYLTAVRLERAKELLRTTDVKISEIAEQVGYQPSYFNRLFKKSEGTTPNRYRQDLQRQDVHARDDRSV